MTVRPEDRRRFARISFRRPASLRAGNERVDCDVMDVSLKGVLVDALSLAAGVGERCAVSIPLAAGDAEIHMDGEVAHREGPLVGIRCTGIDLESISHLRRLVELNLGDEEELQRELAALVAIR